MGVTRSSELDRVISAYSRLRAERRDQPMTPEQCAVAMRGLGIAFPVEDGVAIEPRRAGAVPVDWLTPPGGDAVRRPVVLHVHSGAFVAGGTYSDGGFAANLAIALGGTAVVPAYSLAPASPFPAAIEDLVTVYRWLIDGVGVQPERILLSAASSGAAIALSAVMRLRDLREPEPAMLLMLSPWIDLTSSSRSWHRRAERDPIVGRELLGLVDAYLGAADAASPDASPLFADLSQLPPTLTMVGTEEVLFDDATRFTDQAQEAGSSAVLEIGAGLVHKWPIFHSVPEARTAIARIARFSELRAGSAFSLNA